MAKTQDLTVLSDSDLLELLDETKASVAELPGAEGGSEPSEPKTLNILRTIAHHPAWLIELSEDPDDEASDAATILKELGAEGYLTKPFDFDVIIARVREVVDGG